MSNTNSAPRDYLSKRAALLAPVAAAYLAEGFEGVLAATRGSNHSDMMHAWELAMAAHYGPMTLHKQWQDEAGCPSAACLARFPDVAAHMAQAAEQLTRFLDLHSD